MSHKAGARGKGRKHRDDADPSHRRTTVSKALSFLLRHGAQQERIPMTADGYVRMDQLLAWHKLKSLGVDVAEVLEVVDHGWRETKGRFGVKYVSVASSGATAAEVEQKPVGRSSDGTGNATADVASPAQTQSLVQNGDDELTETEKAIQIFRDGTTDPNPRHFFVRATQGHSLALEDAEALLTPITIDVPSSVPDTVVHGTFYGAWEGILATGGLKPMRRRHVHFATGPKAEEVVGEYQGDAATRSPFDLTRSLTQNKVRSGMRSDAQILVYVDIRRALSAGVKFWRSENGVVLTEGFAKESNNDGREDKILDMEFFNVVVEVERGLGVIWRYGEGVVKELPEELKRMGVPRGKDGRGRGGRGRGSSFGPGSGRVR